MLGYEVVHTLRWVLYLACSELNRPWPTSGVKRWTSKLSEQHRVILAGLPTSWSSDVPNRFLQAAERCLGRAVKPSGALADVDRAIAPPPKVFDLGLAGVIREWFRIQSLLPVVVHRQDWLLGVEGVYTLRRLLYMLYLYENDREVPETVDSWTSVVTADQRAALNGLPTGAPTREGAIGGHAAVASVFEPRARAVCSQLGIEWPTTLAEAVHAHLRRALVET